MFCISDVSCGYWQMEKQKSDHEKLVLPLIMTCTNEWGYSFVIRNVLSRTQRAIDVILTTVRWKHALLYLVDFFILSKTPCEHITHMAMGSGLVNLAGVVTKPKISAFFTNGRNDLCQIIRPGRFKAVNHTANIIRNLKRPTKFTELRSFLGLPNVFMKMYSESYEKLVKLIEKSQKSTLKRPETCWERWAPIFRYPDKTSISP